MNEEKIPMKTSSWNAVNQASGIAAAWLSVRWVGTGIRSFSGTATYSAYPPPHSRAMTLSFGFKPQLKPRPRLSTVPATSRPMMSLSPGGAGYRPLLWGKRIGWEKKDHRKPNMGARSYNCKLTSNTSLSSFTNYTKNKLSLQIQVAVKKNNQMHTDKRTPFTCNKSALFSAVAWTLIRTSPSLGSGLGMERSSKFSGPPGFSTHTALIMLERLEQHLYQTYWRKTFILEFLNR